jgi:cell wall-associated NlpC family hydrolase
MFERSVIEEMRRHARKTWPEECCGIVVEGRYYQLVNRHPDPREHFRIEPADYLPLLNGAPIQAVVHSHVNDHNFPSAADQRGQISMQVAWGIMVSRDGWTSEPFFFGDQAPTPNLKDRVFRHGCTDCYGLVRDWFKIKRGIVLPSFVRDENWWDHGDNLLVKNFTAFGFVEISWHDLAPGDCVLGCIMSKDPNHCGVYLGNNQIFHHLPNRPSRIDMLGPWRCRITHYLRYQG